MVVSARLLLAVRVQPPRAPRFSFPPRRSLQRTLVPLPYIPRARLYSSFPVECNSPISQAYSLSREPFAGRSSSSTTTPHSPNFRVISCSFFPLFISIVVEPLRLFLLLLGMLVLFLPSNLSLVVSPRTVHAQSQQSNNDDNAGHVDG